MDKKSSVYIILGAIIVILAAFLIISNVTSTEFEQQSFTKFVMDVPKGTEFAVTYDDYSTIYTAEDITVKYYRVLSNDDAFHYAEERTLIQSDGEAVDQSGNITEWKINKDGKTKYICFKEDPNNNGACISVEASNKEDCMKMAQSIQFINEAVFTEESSTDTQTTTTNSTASNISANTTQNSGNTTITNNSVNNGRNKVWDGQSNTYIYQETGPDGNVRQYDANGNLIGSTYDEDQSKFSNIQDLE